MAKTVDEGFRVFHTRLTPSSTESQAATKHRASIQACLESNFSITRFWRTGSFGNGTSISGYSDVDYFASIPTKHQRENSITMLRVVCEALDKRFPRTGVRVNTPAIVVPFGTNKSEWTEVVPAYLSSTTPDKHLVYKIANGAGGWLDSSPDAHNAYVAQVNDKLDKKLKALIRFIKAWMYYRDVPISSFYLELRVATYAAKESSIVYSIDVKRVFEKLWEDQLASVRDPMGVSGLIRACSSPSQREDALSKLATAVVRARKAREAEAAGKIADAFTWWDLVYAGHFPAYG